MSTGLSEREVEAESGATSTASWWAHATRQTRAAAHRKTRPASTATPPHPAARNGRLLCPRHHTRAHDPTYEMAKLPDGKVRFHRRT